MATPEILLIQWQQNHVAPWLRDTLSTLVSLPWLPESAKLNIVLHYVLPETVRIWLKWTRKIYISVNISIMSKLNFK